MSSLTIKNRTTVEECKLLTMVKRWAQNTNNRKSLENSSDSNEDKQIWIKSMLIETLDKIFDAPEPENEELNKQIDELNELTKELYEKWNNLKVYKIQINLNQLRKLIKIFTNLTNKNNQQAFKIPKKQRIEERKEYERELNNSNAYNVANVYSDYHKTDRQNNIEKEFRSNNINFFNTCFTSINLFNFFLEGNNTNNSNTRQNYNNNNNNNQFQLGFNNKRFTFNFLSLI